MTTQTKTQAAKKAASLLLALCLAVALFAGLALAAPVVARAAVTGITLKISDGTTHSIPADNTYIGSNFGAAISLAAPLR